MTKIKALRDFLEKFFNYKSYGMTISEILADVTENGEASGGGGYECKEELKTIVDDTIVLEEDPGQEGFYSAELHDLSVTIKEKINYIAVTFDGKAYQLPLIVFDSRFWLYGEFTPDTEEAPGVPVYDNFPVFVNFAIYENAISDCFIGSNISGEHTIKIEIPEESVTVTPCFKKAVAKATTENNRTYVIPETTGETETRTDEIADLGKVTFYYLDVSVNNEPSTFPLYFEVDGKITTFKTIDELQNFICTTPRAVINALKSSEYALYVFSVGRSGAVVFFREPGTHTVSMYADKTEESGGSNTFNVKLHIEYANSIPVSVSFSATTFEEFLAAHDRGDSIVFSSTYADEAEVVPFMYRLERGDDDTRDVTNILVYRIYPLDAELAVEGYRLSSENVTSVSYVTVPYSHS